MKTFPAKYQQVSKMICKFLPLSYFPKLYFLIIVLLIKVVN